ncbi:hypothetical protein QVN42_03145 [Yersinia nurmii]|uniref:Uncharacterized protein n=1 Tax=Yersinia nurmii TaxID=685706 RepID=A0AAW7JUG7_9GAMM|nr:hypothetical protein [Yersinia nurmii]MDN0086398.1 hypothetical protein [Yersinia nurmii]CNE51338.1 Uncharacterised protein [Yersinia nurmii]
MYVNRSIASANDALNACTGIISSILGPAEQWEDALNMASQDIINNNIQGCRYQLSGMQVGVSNSISGIELQLGDIEDISEDVQDILLTPVQDYQPEQGDIPETTISKFREDVGELFDTITGLQDFCEVVLGDLNSLNDTLNIGVNPYDYDSYNSLTVAKMQVDTCYTGITTLRIDVFEG